MGDEGLGGRLEVGALGMFPTADYPSMAGAAAAFVAAAAAQVA
jgi:hypothetical protein